MLPPAAAERRDAPLTLAGRARFAGRFVLGSAAGLAFVPIGAALALRARLAPALMAAAGAVAAPARAATVLWRFSRPHTIIGTAVSVAGLFAISVDALGGVDAGTAAFHLFWTLVAGLSVNVFIVGINQITDVEIDRVNKPGLPIAAGDLSVERAWAIVAASAVAAGRARAHAGRAGARRGGRRAGDRDGLLGPAPAPEALRDRRHAVRLRRALGDRQPRRGRALHVRARRRGRRSRRACGR